MSCVSFWYSGGGSVAELADRDRNADKAEAYSRCFISILTYVTRYPVVGQFLRGLPTRRRMASCPTSKLIHLLIATEDKLRTCYSDWSWDVLLGCCLLSAS